MTAEILQQSINCRKLSGVNFWRVNRRDVGIQWVNLWFAIFDETADKKQNTILNSLLASTVFSG